MTPACHSAEGGMSAMGHAMMEGLPSWALYGAMAAAAVITVWGLLHRPAARTSPLGPRLRLTSLRPIRWLLTQRFFQPALQLPVVLALGLILWAGFDGTPVPERNLATVLTWTVWWTLLILDVVLFGRVWCLVCPWEALASWLRRLAFWRRSDEPLALGLPFPRFLRNVYPATFLFLCLTWLELGYGVTFDPAATAGLGLVMVVLAVVPALVFERRAFCKYGCLVGRVVGIYSMVAPLEVRPRSPDVCRGCKTKDCLVGNDKGYPCPTGQCLGTMSSNTYCTVCTECFKTCPHDNVDLNLRPWATDLDNVRKPRRDEAALALVMLSMTSFHGFTMTPTWNSWLSGLMNVWGLGRLATFSCLMAVILVVPASMYLATAALASWLGRGRRRSLIRPAGFGATATAYAYPLVALALMYHLAHNAGHFLMEGASIVPVISDPLGRGSDLFGTASFVPQPLTSMTVVWALMIVFVLLGHWWATRALWRAHDNVTGGAASRPLSRAARGVAALFPLLVTLTNLWLLAQPMEMRTGL